MNDSTLQEIVDTERFTDEEVTAIILHANSTRASKENTRASIYDIAKDLGIPQERIDAVIAERKTTDPLTIVRQLPNPTAEFIHRQLAADIARNMELAGDYPITSKTRHPRYRRSEQGEYPQKEFLLSMPQIMTIVNVEKKGVVFNKRFAHIEIATRFPEEMETGMCSYGTYSTIEANALPPIFAPDLAPLQRHVTMTFRTSEAAAIYGMALNPLLERWKEYITTIKTT